MAMQESVIHIKLTTAVIIVIALLSGALMVISHMSTLVINLNQSVMGVHQRVNEVKSAVDLHHHRIDQTLSKIDEVVGAVGESQDTQDRLTQSTSEIQQQAKTVLDGVSAFLAEHADTPEDVDATE